MKKINKKLLNYCLTTPTNSIFNDLIVPGSIKKVFQPMNTDKRHMWFISEKPAKHLLVAHLDAVTDLDNKTYIKKDVLMNKGLDDRLGLYTCLYLQAKYQCFDILLTDNEETGQSTAQHFSCPDYNFIIEFDKAGIEEFVMYDTSDDLGEAIIESTGYIEGFGSYSDIADISTDTASVNWCICYREYHTKNSHVLISEYMQSISDFELFFSENKDNRFYKNEDDWNDYHETELEEYWNSYGYNAYQRGYNV